MPQAMLQKSNILLMHLQQLGVIITRQLLLVDIVDSYFV